MGDILKSKSFKDMSSLLVAKLGNILAALQAGLK
jgi:hypothetical protein